MSEITEIAQIGQNEGHAKLVLGAHRGELDAAIFESQAAAATVIVYLDEFVLQGFREQIVTEAGGNVQACARDVAVAKHAANLLGERLNSGVALQAKIRGGKEKFAVRAHLKQRADGGDFLDLRVVLENLFGIIAAAGSELQVADDGRPVARRGGKGKSRNGIEGLKNV